MKFEFEKLHYLLGLIPLILILGYVYFIQEKALKWIEENISPRFQKELTVYNRLTLKIQFFIFFIMGTLLLLAATNPQREAKTEVEIKDKGIVIFLIDGSLSMLAGDTSVNPITKLKPYDRFAEAQQFASDLVDLFPQNYYGIITFSGDFAVHTMPIQNPVEVKKILHSLLVHNFENTGLLFIPVFHELQRISEVLNETFQVVLISDGEQLEKQREDLTEELENLKEKGIVIHTVGVGTSSGGAVVFSIVWYDSEKTDTSESEKDDRSGYQQKESKRESLFTHNTYRQDEILRKIAKETEGKYLIVEKGDWAEDLKEQISQHKSKKISKRQADGKESLSAYFLLSFLILLILNLFIIFQPKPFWIWKSLLQKIPILKDFLLFTLLLIFLINCSEEYTPKMYLAHKYNEQGRELLKKSKLEDAKLAFNKAISYQFREHIINFNLANVYYLEQDYKTAHDRFQRAIGIYPNFPEALFNDGLSLYKWGESELSEEICDVERAISLWESAILRFREVGKLKTSSELESASSENLFTLEKELELLKEKGEDYCKEKSQDQLVQNTTKQEDSSQKDKSDSKDSSQKDKSDSKDSSQKDKFQNQKSRSMLPRDYTSRLELTEKEQKEIDAAFDRLAKRQIDPKTHKRSRHQQSNKQRNTEELKKLLEEALY